MCHHDEGGRSRGGSLRRASLPQERNDGMNTPICDFVDAYRKRDMSRLHMPGHKGVSFLGCEEMDLTEISGADALYEAEGIIAESEANATRLFGFGRTLYSTEGSSQCIRAMLFLALQESGERRGRPFVLAGRNAHKGFLYSCALLDLDVIWLLPTEGERGSLCTCPITAAQVAEQLRACEERPIAVYLTAPDYLGYSPDLAAIAAVCKAWEVPLLVDNAHGAYLKFLQPSRHPIDLGAAMSCDSAHKTLPVLTGGAYLQLSPAWEKRCGKNAKQAMELFGSTSPSYLTLASLDRCNAYLAEGYPSALAKTVHRVAEMKEKLSQAGWRCMEGDPLKLTVFTGERGYRGEEAAEILRKAEIECEFADQDAVVLMVTPENAERDLQRAERVFQGLPPKEPPVTAAVLPRKHPKQRCSIREAIFCRWERISVREAVGRICASPCVSCPPAIPIAASGEEITSEMIELFCAYGIETVQVVKEK